MFPKQPPKVAITTRDFDPINQRNLKALENGGKINFFQQRALIAIGNGHKPEVMEIARLGGEGHIIITKGSGADPGTLEVHGPADRTEFVAAIKRISKKKVVFK